MKKRNHNFAKAIISFVILSILIISVSSYFLFNKRLIGPVFIFLGFVSLLFFRFLKVDVQSAYSDIVFGATDNFILVFAAIIGGTYAGVAGAIIGGVAGNTLSDGFAGLVEGRVVEKLKRKLDHKRTALSTMLGKVTGCLFAAGIALTIIYLISLI